MCRRCRPSQSGRPSSTRWYTPTTPNPAARCALRCSANRLEVENPGLLPFGLTIDEIQLGVSRVRNRVLARVFRELGYVEQWGSGIQRMTRACVDAGHPPPEFAGRFRVVLATARATPAPPVDADHPQPTGQARGAGPAGGDRKQRERPTPPLLPPRVEQCTRDTSRLYADQRSGVCRASGIDPEHVFLPVGQWARHWRTGTEQVRGREVTGLPVTGLVRRTVTSFLCSSLSGDVYFGGHTSLTYLTQRTRQVTNRTPDSD